MIKSIILINNSWRFEWPQKLQHPATKLSHLGTKSPGILNRLCSKVWEDFWEPYSHASYYSQLKTLRERTCVSLQISIALLAIVRGWVAACFCLCQRVSCTFCVGVHHINTPLSFHPWLRSKKRFCRMDFCRILHSDFLKCYWNASFLKLSICKKGN
jgi:hypothetical protein